MLVYAYLLIPRQGHAPFPLSSHTINAPSIVNRGKEAVVGKVAERPDQRYGLELVRRGYVVLAPDSINCGERCVPGSARGGRYRASR